MPVIRPRKVKPKRVKLDLRTVTLRLSIREAVYLDALVSFGLHGISRQEVVHTFLRRGIEGVIRDRLLDR